MIIEINIKSLHINYLPERERERETLDIVIRAKEIIVINKSLSLHTFYFIILDDVVYISTSQSKFKKIINLEIDTDVAIENIALVNQLSDSSTFTNVESLNPGENLTVSNGKASKGIQFDPSELLATDAALPKILDYEQASDILLSAVKNCLKESPKPKLLALSGGVDSRLIAAAMLYIGERPTCYTMGAPDESDVTVAKSLTLSAGLKWHHFNPASVDHLPSDMTELKKYIKVFAEYSLNSTSLSASIRRLPVYDFASSHHLIDGGFGEIFRSRYLYKLRYLNLIKRIGTKDIAHQLFARNHRTGDQFRSRIEKKVEELWNKTSSLSLPERLDIFSIATRLKHFGGAEHRRLNSFIHSSMPFASDDLLRQMFKIHPRVRSSKRFIAYCIHKWHSDWDAIPFTKFEQTQKLFQPDMFAKMGRYFNSKNGTISSNRDVIINLYSDEFESLWQRYGDFGIFTTQSGTTPKELNDIIHPLEWLTLALARD